MHSVESIDYRCMVRIFEEHVQNESSSSQRQSVREEGGANAKVYGKK